MLRVTKQWLLSKSASSLNFADASYHHQRDGDSMEPGIRRGDFVIVDTSQQLASYADGLYAIQYSITPSSSSAFQIHPGGKVRANF